MQTNLFLNSMNSKMKSPEDLNSLEQSKEEFNVPQSINSIQTKTDLKTGSCPTWQEKK